MLNMPHPRHGQHQACTPRKSCNRGSENSVARREIGDGRCAYPSSKRHEWNVVDGWKPWQERREQGARSQSSLCSVEWACEIAHFACGYGCIRRGCDFSFIASSYNVDPLIPNPLEKFLIWQKNDPPFAKKRIN